jgi:hypothetical protein
LRKSFPFRPQIKTIEQVFYADAAIVSIEGAYFGALCGTGEFFSQP